MCQTKAAQRPPNGAAMHMDVVGISQFQSQLVQRDLSLFGDMARDPVGHTRQFAMPAAIALTASRQTACLAPQFDQIIHEPSRNPEAPCRFAVTVPFIDKRNHPLMQFYWMRLAHL